MRRMTRRRERNRVAERERRDNYLVTGHSPSGRELFRVLRFSYLETWKFRPWD